MLEQRQLTLQKLRRNLLDQLEKAREAIEELSDEQLVSVAGGICSGSMPMGPMGKDMPMVPMGVDLPPLN